MKLILALLTFLGVLAFTSPVEAHDDSHPESMQAVLPGQFFADVSGVGLDPAETFAENLTPVELFTAPDYAMNCQATIRSSRTSIYAMCYNYSGSGSRQFQVAGYAFDGCNRYMWFYGNVGWVYVPGVNTSGKASLVYTGPGTWQFKVYKIIIFKP